MLNEEKLNVAVVISSDLHSGGGYQYEYMVLNILRKYQNHFINFSFYTMNNKVIADYKELNIPIKLIKETFLNKIKRILLSNIFFHKRILSKMGIKISSIEKIFLKDNNDIVYFISPNNMCNSLVNIPYVFTVWDLEHLRSMEFPEVSYERVFEQRELLYSESLKKAYSVIVDSDYGKLFAIEKYNLDKKRITVLKYLPNVRLSNDNEYIDIKSKYNIKNDYIFYPAQFWAHKNHIYILKAIKILKEEKGVNIDVIFSGSNKGNLEYILNKAKKYKIDNLIHYIGFAPNEEIPYLYKQSLSLVMPTYLGPTNIPPLEAFAYETTVCYSDTPFFKEQVGNAVFWMDLNNPFSLVENILEIKNNKQLVNKKINLGKKILINWNEEDFYKKLIKIFTEYQYIRSCWGK